MFWLIQREMTKKIGWLTAVFGDIGGSVAVSYIVLDN